LQECFASFGVGDAVQVEQGHEVGAPDRVEAGFEPADRSGVAVREVVAYGIALPNGSVATVGASGRGFAQWASLDSASERMCSELVWLGR
jgi:hypothetical protein